MNLAADCRVDCLCVDATRDVDVDDGEGEVEGEDEDEEGNAAEKLLG